MKAKLIGNYQRGKGKALTIYSFDYKKPPVGHIIRMYLPATHEQAAQGYMYTRQDVLVVENDLGELLYRKRLSGCSQGWVKKSVRFHRLAKWSAI